MNLLCSRWSTLCVAVLFGCVLVWPTPAGAQTFVELGGGWNYLASAPSGAEYGTGSNVRASIGWQVAPGFRWRIDAFTSQFDVRTTIVQPFVQACPSFGCSGPGYGFQSERVNGLTANGLVNLDPRGIVYVIGGAGLYDVQTQATEWHVGVSAGAGIAVPVATHLRAVVEVRWHGLLGTTSGPPWLVPITVGLRY
jgi:hypothetical protein